MANTFRLKRSSVASKVPTTGDLQLGELALNTYDGKLYTKKDNGTASIVEIGAGGGVADGDKGDITVSSSGTVWTLDPSGVTAGTYNNSATAITPLTVDAKGRITATGAAVTVTPAFSSVTGKPTTLSGYGITDAPTTTGTGASGTWGINVTGNAATATTWQTARTLTLGDTGKSVNGSANVTWTAPELGFSAAQAYNTVSISGVTTAAAISFGAEAFDNDNLWAVGSPTRITIPRAGVYRLEFSALVTFTADTYVLTFSLRKNTTEIRSFVYRENWRWFNGDTFTVAFSDIESLAANDYLEIFHSGDSTGYSIGTAAASRAQFSIHRVS